MNKDMDKAILSSEKFDIPYLPETVDNLGSNSQIDADELFDIMMSKLPKDAFHVGTTAYEVDNWTTWTILDHYFVVPLKDEQYDRALIRLAWDDNWMTWFWSFDVRMGNFTGSNEEAAYIMIKELWEKKWRLELEETHLKLLRKLKGS